MDDLELPVPPPLRYRTHEPVLTSNWTRVERFSARSTSVAEDDDDEWEEEEVEYVTLDFGSQLSKQSLNDATSFQLLAAESSTPFVRIGNQYFNGLYETSIGTEILLQPTSRNDVTTGERGRGERNGKEGKEEEETPMQVFATTGSNRIVLQPVPSDYAKRLPTLVAGAGAAARGS
ncbi:uncharacterized protein JCM6883_005486 [Sporobolomyces salmoneus]|uniref:uncharacterized protein n=1 Tax=Sporobolomyces salmoneus TaxID=183962 RepID=UPI00317A4C1A